MKHFLITSLVLLLNVLVTSAQVEIPARLSDRPELIIKHTGYTVSYNTARGTPNWSAWVLTRSHVNSSTSVSRSDVFLPDPMVPLAYRVQPDDYTNTGYDRGHLYPAADASWSSASMHDSFYMSNMTPQVPNLNRIYWKQLEDACRRWAISEDTLYIVAGPVYSKVHKVLVSSSNPPYTIHHNPSIDVPTGFFKVILSLRQGHAKAIGFYYQNTSTKQSMISTVSTVDYIESLTGIDFFYTLPDDIEERLESHCNLYDWR